MSVHRQIITIHLVNDLYFVSHSRIKVTSNKWQGQMTSSNKISVLHLIFIFLV